MKLIITSIGFISVDTGIELILTHLRDRQILGPTLPIANQNTTFVTFHIRNNGIIQKQKSNALYALTVSLLYAWLEVPETVRKYGTHTIDSVIYLHATSRIFRFAYTCTYDSMTILAELWKPKHCGDSRWAYEKIKIS